MKKYLLVGLVIAGAAIGTANAQSFTAPANPNAKQRLETKPVTPLPRREAVGAFPRAVRGNPIQMINPGAPQRYFGAPSETVSAEHQPERPRNAAREGNHFENTGVILVGVRF